MSPPRAAREEGTAEGTAGGAWLLLGPEEGEKSSFIKKLSAGLEERLGQPPEVSRYYGGDSPAAAIVQRLRNLSLFSRHRMAIVFNTEELKGPEAELIVEYLRAPAQDATLVLTSAGFASEIDRRIAGDPRRKAAGAIPPERQKIFWEMFESQKQGWVTSFFRQRSITIDPEAVETLLDLVQNNTRDMRVECERLALFFGPGSTLTLERIEQYVYHSKEENVFTLFDRLCQGALQPAVEVLERILLSREAEATQLAGGLLLQFRRLAAYERMQAAGYGDTEAFQKLRIFSKRSQKSYAEGSRRFPAHDLERILRLLVEFDERFRSMKTDLHALLLRLLVYRIVPRAGRGASPPSP